MGSAFHPSAVGKAGLGVTVTESEPMSEPSCAVIVEVPPATPLTKPDVLTVATVEVSEVHVAADVRFCWLPSLKVPVAVSWSVPPRITTPFAGVTATETSSGAVTVSCVELFMAPEVAVMVLWPCATDVARPEELMVATVVLEDDHITELVRSCVLPPVKVPVALNCCITPATIEGFAGKIANFSSTAGLTLTDAIP